MITIDTIRSGINNLLSAFLPEFTSWQESFKNDAVRSPSGRYWQGLAWPSTVPADGAAVEPADAETDAVAGGMPEGYSWRKIIRQTIAIQGDGNAFWRDLAGALKAGTPPSCLFQILCTEYLDPLQGTGWTITCKFVWQGHTWIKSVGVGPNAENDSVDWYDSDAGL